MYIVQAEIAAIGNRCADLIYMYILLILYSIIALVDTGVIETPGKVDRFSVYWNVPTQRCARNYGIHVNVSRYGVITNSEDGWRGKHITIFPKPGLYPRATANGTLLNGGIPQRADLSAHLAAMEKTVTTSIPWPDFAGLAVVDYEAWKPVWERNWAAKQVYQTLSEILVKERHPEWSKDKVKIEAKQEFEASARKFLVTTLSVCRRIRSGGLWGYYLYPDCYNYAGETTCSNRTEEFNDRILWLFRSGTAIYPSGYLESPSNHTKNRNLVHGMVKEALRIQSLLQKQTHDRKPVFLYSRFRYKDGIYYSKSDLHNSVQQARDLGADGVVLWDDHDLSSSKSVCKSVQSYLDNVLGPFIQHLL